MRGPHPGARVFFSPMTYVAPPSSSRTIDRPRLEAVIDPIARAHGAEVVDFEWNSEPGGWVLRARGARPEPCARRRRSGRASLSPRGEHAGHRAPPPPRARLRPLRREEG